jgi:hypothetical protein
MKCEQKFVLKVVNSSHNAVFRLKWVQFGGKICYKNWFNFEEKIQQNLMNYFYDRMTSLVII